MPSNLTADPLVASSYFHPSGGEAYAPLRKAIVDQATAMGYDVPTMAEHGVAWADDQDPFGHVGGSTFARLIFKLNFRVFESFAKTLGDKYEDLQLARGVGMIIRSYNMELKRQVKYPDCFLLASRISEVYPDRYFGITTFWSYQQQAIVAESTGYAVFFDYRKQQVANLLEYGGVYADLHKELTERSKKSNELHAQWVLKHPKLAGKAKL
ncbi:hypothetical protein B0H16DRAFT_1424921 [Mycena metata]|uniref:Uncharacterized protein n=1 Tax=Mycena metata TaxID=1033252 RepID=A0AAD7MYZ7_9AGAR|nr:hypothetical protein B0H16DRAFT_1424921 [Mycena metata]